MVLKIAFVMYKVAKMEWGMVTSFYPVLLEIGILSPYLNLSWIFIEKLRFLFVKESFSKNYGTVPFAKENVGFCSGTSVSGRKYCSCLVAIILSKNETERKIGKGPAFVFVLANVYLAIEVWHLFIFLKKIAANQYREEAGCGHEARALRALKEGVRLAPTQHLVWLSLGAVACQLTDWPLAQHAFIR
jgi:hypothetical protein